MHDALARRLTTAASCPRTSAAGARRPRVGSPGQPDRPPTGGGVFQRHRGRGVKLPSRTAYPRCCRGHQRTLTLGGGGRIQCVPDQRGQCGAGGLRLPLSPHRGTGHAGPTQVTVGQLQGSGLLQDLLVRVPGGLAAKPFSKGPVGAVGLTSWSPRFVGSAGGEG